MHEKLTREMRDNRSAALPRLPGKRLMRDLSEAYLTERSRELETYLVALVRDPVLVVRCVRSVPRCRGGVRLWCGVIGGSGAVTRLARCAPFVVRQGYSVCVWCGSWRGEGVVVCVCGAKSLSCETEPTEGPCVATVICGLQHQALR